MKKIKLIKKHSHKSSLWLNRHINDEFLLKSKLEGFRSRSSFKLIQIDHKFKIFNQNKLNILDLGCAPGGWLQVIKRLTNYKKSKILGIDKLIIKDINGINFLQRDIFENKTIEEINNFFGEKIDILLSDMSPNTSGNRSVDHLKIVSLIESVLDISELFLKKMDSLFAKFSKEEHKESLWIEYLKFLSLLNILNHKRQERNRLKRI